nr:hypothetical protein GCM10025699_77680 [Microbacterium flavescens]
MLKNTLTKKKSLLIAGGIAGVLVLGGGGVAIASGLDDRVSPQSRDRAQEALAETGGGTVTEVDTLDDGLAGYEVEVTLPDGRETHVLLGDDYSVASSRIDDDSRDDSGDDRSDDRDDDSIGSVSTPGTADDDSDDSNRGDDDLTGTDYDQAAAAAIAAAANRAP